MKFNEYVKEYRLKYFKNLEKFAKIIGVTKTMWRKIERGINPPPKKDKNEVEIITLFHDKLKNISFKRCGRAVPKTNAPTNRLKDFPKPQPALFFKVPFQPPFLCLYL